MKRPSSKPVVFEGTHYPSIVDLCRAYGVNYGAYWSRKKKGWTDREALEIDKRKLVNGNAKSYVVYGRSFASQIEVCAAYDVPVITFQKRIKNGLTVPEALGIEPNGRSRSKPQSFEGKWYPSTKALCDAHDVPTRTYHGRRRRGCSQREALGLDIRKNISPTAKPVEFEGKRYPTRRDLYEECGVSESTYLSRRKAGWTERAALGLDKHKRSWSRSFEEQAFDLKVEKLRGKLPPKQFYGVKRQSTPEQWAAQLDYTAIYREANREKSRKYNVDWI